MIEESEIVDIISHGSVNAKLYIGDCLILMDQFIESKLQVDMIFADPPYFLSNDGISCQNGKMVSVNKGDWDKSNGVERNQDVNSYSVQMVLFGCQELTTLSTQSDFLFRL